jgi:hypothetical protein
MAGWDVAVDGRDLVARTKVRGIARLHVVGWETMGHARGEERHGNRAEHFGLRHERVIVDEVAQGLVTSKGRLTGRRSGSAKVNGTVVELAGTLGDLLVGRLLRMGISV